MRWFPHIQARYLGHGLAGDRLEIADHADRRLDDGKDLHVALRPLPAHEFALSVEIVPVCTENLIRVDDVIESHKLAE